MKFVMKYLFTNQNFHFSLSSIFWKKILMKHYAYLIIFVKFKCLTGPNIVPDFITYVMVAQYFLWFFLRCH